MKGENMKIKEFCKKYNAITGTDLKDNFIKYNLDIKSYIPFIKKEALSQNLVDISTYKYEDYVKEDGTVGRRKTGTISVNSTLQYLLFCRIIIENYTNLEVETDGFFEEYDALKQSGLLDKLMVGTDSVAPLISYSEISEFRTIVDMKTRDAMTNYSTPQAYISNQVERFGGLLSVTLKPVLEKISDRLEKLDEKDMDKIAKSI